MNSGFEILWAGLCPKCGPLALAAVTDRLVSAQPARRRKRCPARVAARPGTRSLVDEQLSELARLHGLEGGRLDPDAARATLANFQRVYEQLRPFEKQDLIRLVLHAPKSEAGILETVVRSTRNAARSGPARGCGSTDTKLVLALLGLAVGVFAACSSGAPKNAATPVASQEAVASPSAGATTTPATETIGGVPVRTFTVGAPALLPNGYVFYEVQWQWEGPAKAVQRAYRASDGKIRVDVLYETNLTGSPPDGPAIASVAASLDGASMAIGVCRGFCYGETGPISVISSVDSGITWSELGTVNPSGRVRGAGSGSALVQTLAEMVVLPANGGKPMPISGQDDVLLMGSDPLPIVLIRGSDGATLTRADGAAFGRAPLPAGSTVEAIQPAASGSAGLSASLAVDWYVATTRDPARVHYSGLMDGPGGPLRTVFRWGAPLRLGSSIGSWLRADQEIRMVSFAPSLFGDRFAGHGTGDINLPAIVDWNAGTVSPILEHFADGILGPKSGSPAVLAVAKGPFVRVTTGSDCLNVREVPGKSSVAVLGCFRDGVLLRLRPEPEQPFGGAIWLAVATPDGQSGWASAEFLER
jgi:hypothetical protein